jgi:hypothetical protein
VERFLPGEPPFADASHLIVMSGVDTGLPQQKRVLADQAVFLRKPFNLEQLLAIVARLLPEDPSDATS